MIIKQIQGETQMNTTVIKLILMCCLISTSFTQELLLEPFGVSPRDAASNTSDIFDIAYNALTNVGIGTKQYLKAEFVDSTITNLTWSVTSSPANSTYTLGTAVAEGDNIEFASFIPDSIGTYILTISEGSVSATITINAGTFLGVSNGTPSCETCHNEKFTEWTQTGHSDMLVRALNGTLSNYYGSYCVSCHVVGQDGAVNDGFDDFDFVYPDSTTLVDVYGDTTGGHLFNGLYDLLAADYPVAFERANIQCESCHGPGSEHFGTPDIMSTSLDAQTCALCHDSGTHHAYPDQWENSKHALLPHGGYAGSRASCAPCHSGSGFMAWVEGGQQPLTEAPPVEKITCAACHDPHSAENAHQLRLNDPVVLGDGTIIQDGGNGKLCMNCHKGRRDPSYYEYVHYSSHFGPHHGPQADMLAGANVPTFGQTLPSSPHLSATDDACVTCHMAGDHVADDLGNIIQTGGHTFSMTDPNGVDNVEACAGCHGNFGESFDEKMYYFNGVADHDGDGIDEGLQDEIHGLLEELALLLPPIDSSAVDVGGDYIYTLTEIQAAFNYLFVEEDRSGGIHNPAFAVALLKVSINALEDQIAGNIVAIEDVPNDQGYQVRIVWDNLVDDITAYDPVATYIVKRYDDYGSEVGWTNVGEVTADGSPRYALEVETVFNNVDTDTAWTAFKIVALTQSGVAVESESGEGFSIDNLVPTAPLNMMASVVVDYTIQLAWEAPADPDINFYRVYRSTSPSFPADETTEIDVVTDLEYYDSGLSPNTYYYKVAAVDFSGNLGDLSSEVSAEVLSIAFGSIPIEYSLSQNFPNPFNPVTTINFTLPEAGFVNLTVFNSVGQVVAELINKDLDVGYHNITFSADYLPSGIYFYRINSNNYTKTKKMLLLK